MLTAIRIGNFKAFAETQRIPLAPLTLIYGANSSGKSSVIHSLIYSSHAIETGELDVNLTKIGGAAVDLGGFRQFVHQRKTELRVHLEWELATQAFNKRLREDLIPGVKKAMVGVNLGLSVDDSSLRKGIPEAGEYTPRQILSWLIEAAKKEGDKIEVEKLEGMLAESERLLTLEEIYELKKKVRVEKFWLDLDDRRFLSLSSREMGHLQLDLLDREHNAASFLINSLISVYSTTDHVDPNEINSLSEAIDEMVPKISFKVQKFFPTKLTGSDDFGGLSRKMSLIAVKKESRLEDLKKVVESNLPVLIEEIVIGISESVKQELKKISYLGPLRTYPPRHVGFSEYSDSNWVAGGGAAWDLVKKDSRIRQKVNEWLGDEKKLAKHYELRIRYLLTINSLKGKLAELSSKATSEFAKYYDDVMEGNYEGDVFPDVFSRLDEEVDKIPEKLEKLESLFSDIQELILYDKRSKTIVSHRDVGIGISQVLPVLVTSFASSGRIIALEQPEIHLHPALQAELGDVFIEAALGERKNTLIIETHSEHILLRIMRRIRETASGKLPEGILPVHPEDVMVLFVQPEGSRSIIHEIPLNEKGDLVKPWPGGFFEEDFKELF